MSHLRSSNMRGSVGRLVAGTVLAGLMAGGAGAQLFTDVTQSAGVGAVSYSSANNHGLGAIWIDYDRDGWPDLLATNGKNKLTRLYHNLGDGTFASADTLLPALPNVEMMGAVFADIDNDGDSDIYIFTDNELLQLTQASNPPDGPANLLLVNRFVENGHRILEGQPLFEERAALAGVDDLAPAPFGPTYAGYRSTSGAFLDYDRDGYVDLYVGHWDVNHPHNAANMDRMYRNNGDGTFSDVTLGADLYPGGSTAAMRPALAVVAGQLDGDLWPDIYVANIQSTALGAPPAYHLDRVLRNDAQGRFIDAVSDSPGMGDDAQSAMGVAIGDLELDGDWDIYISDILFTNFDAQPLGNPLYLGNGNGTFSDNVALTHGVIGDSSWGVSLIDYDHDGYEDLFVGLTVEDQTTKLYHNNGNGFFTDVSAMSGIMGVPPSPPGPAGMRGSALADYDGDGDLDLVCMNQSAHLGLFRNDAPNQGHWLKVDLSATVSNRDAIGAVVLVAAGGQVYRRQVKGGTSAHSQDALQVHFGLGTATEADLLTVLWPSGLVNSVAAVAADATVTVVEAPQDIEMYGRGSSGKTAKYAPSLIAYGETDASKTVHIDLRSAPGGAQTFYVLGLGKGNATLGNGLPFLVSNPLASVLGPFVVGGSGLGKGSLDLSFPVPPGLPMGVSVSLQAFLGSLPGQPTMPSASNGVLLTF